MTLIRYCQQHFVLIWRHACLQILVLAWADNRKDLEVVWKLLSQFCLAYRGDGGRTIVVLSRREKLVRDWWNEHF